MLRFIGPLIAFTIASSAIAQGGVRLIVWNYEPIFAEGGFDRMSHIGVGFDHDLNDRLSMGLDGRIGLAYSANSWVVEYRSAFHFADTESASAYFGPTLGVRSISGEDAKTVVPLGFRIGVRGGLERFYADLYAGVKYYVGGSGRVTLNDGAGEVDLRSGTFCVGLDLGWGWEGK